MASKTKAWWSRVALAAFLALSLVPLIPDDADAQSQQKQVSPALTARLKGVMVPLLEKMDNPIPLNEVKVSIAEDPNINAGNAGGGNFLVTTGLLQRANDNQLRSIMAHEAAHADLGHVQHQELLNTGLGIGISLLDQLFPGSNALTPIAGQFVSSAYSRKEELEADAHGVEILKRAGYDGKRLMGDTLGWLSKQDGGTGAKTSNGLGGFFSTHPATGDRIQAVRNLQ